MRILLYQLITLINKLLTQIEISPWLLMIYFMINIMINIKIKIIKFYEKENKEEIFLKRGMTKRRPERRRELAVQTLR